MQDDFGSNFAQTLGVTSLADYHQALRDELRARAAAQYSGQGKLGNMNSIALTPSPQPSVPTAGMGQTPGLQRTSDEVAAQGAAAASGQTVPQPRFIGPPPLPPTQAGPIGPPPIATQADVQEPVEPPIPSLRPEDQPGQAPDGISPQALLQLRRAIHANHMRYPNLTMRDLYGVFGSDETAQKAIPQLMGFGPLSPEVMQRLQEMGSVSLPDYSQVTGTALQPAQEEARLDQESLQSGARALQPGGQPQVGTDAPFAQNLQQAGPQVALGLQADQTKLAVANRRADLLARHYAQTSNNIVLQNLQKTLDAAMNPISGIVNPQAVSVAQANVRAATAVALEGPEAAMQDPEIAGVLQQHPEFLQVQPVTGNTSMSETVRTSRRAPGTKPAGTAPKGLEGLNWDNIPQALRTKIQSHLSAGVTPQVILGSTDVKPYLKR